MSYLKNLPNPNQFYKINQNHKYIPINRHRYIYTSLLGYYQKIKYMYSINDKKKRWGSIC